MEADVGDARKVDDIIMWEDADEDRDVELADDEGIKIAAARTDDGIDGNAWIISCTGCPPALPR